MVNGRDNTGSPCSARLCSPSPPRPTSPQSYEEQYDYELYYRCIAQEELRLKKRGHYMLLLQVRASLQVNARPRLTQVPAHPLLSLFTRAYTTTSCCHGCTTFPAVCSS